MIGNLITKIREEKNMTKTELARIIGIDLGHLAHIEKGERIPSRKTLKKISLALNVPYYNLLLAYEQPLAESPETYTSIDHHSFNKILALDSINDFIDCPYGFEMASFAIKMKDSSMEPYIKKDEFAYINSSSPLEINDIGLFKIDNEFLIRFFIPKENKILLKPANSSFKSITISNLNNFYIIGKVLQKS